MSSKRPWRKIAPKDDDSDTDGKRRRIGMPEFTQYSSLIRGPVTPSVSQNISSFTNAVARPPNSTALAYTKNLEPIPNNIFKQFLPQQTLSHSDRDFGSDSVNSVQSLQELFFPSVTTPERTQQLPGVRSVPPWKSPSQALNRSVLDLAQNGAPNASILSRPSHDMPRFDCLSADPTNAMEIANLLENIRPDEDLPPELRVGTPDSMIIPLLEHQKLGLAWLKQQEEGSTKGGILADDMGLGKTIQAIALMVTRQSPDPANKTTLIIAPVALLSQWESEIKDKLKEDRLTVYKHHGSSKRSFDYLRKFDVVLTSFGSLAAELKVKNNPDARPAPREILSLIGDNCRWYRVIIDEAQYIKNKDIQAAKAAYLLNAEYRLCMTGTPMMNNVTELYSLLRFCRIWPFDNWKIFRQEIQKPLAAKYNFKRGDAMKKLQSIIRAVMLRRTKTSKIDNKPILQLPDRTVNVITVKFNESEHKLYTALEERAQLLFKKEGTGIKNYASALHLLLRLRQACCHRYLVEKWDPTIGIDVPAESMESLAEQLSESVVAEIKAESCNFMCPVCSDMAENPVIFVPCGHRTCTECFSRLTDPSNAIASGSVDTEANCPGCHGKIDPKKIIDFTTFKKVHQLELTKEGKAAKNEDDTSNDLESSGLEGVEEESGSEGESLSVSDDEGDTVQHGDEGESSTMERKSIAQLKAKTTRKHFHQVCSDWTSSSKIDRTMGLLAEISQRKPVEKVLIFSQFSSFLDILEIPIYAKGYEYRRYDGSMSGKERSGAVLSFKESSVFTIMLISLKAGNAGLNLNCASQVIILDPFWNPFIEEQAIDRAHRIGQIRPVQVHRILVDGTVEDRISMLQENKRKLIDEALDENARKSVRKLGVQELAYLLFGISNSRNN